MRRSWLSGLALAAIVLATVVVAAGRGGDDPSPEARTRRIASGLRCPSCQGLSVADSPSGVARAIVADVTERVEAGESDAAIRAVYVDRYGEWILLSPSSEGIGALVWVLPALALALAAGGLVLAFRRWRSEPVLVAGDDDRRLVEQARLARVEEPT